ncbi:hypothetical protein QWY96_18000 [Vibrio artabrorum]|uniref:Uncharacterized protein n=2 Tax=Vibrio artabrorum TaxID=446374 RepID=A0ABT8CP67_9VIBR|nr:hypothetical protein [Vibrio artabrorum]MDN3702328.1 hypothetical protein [Vibrio artabrorum]
MTQFSAWTFTGAAAKAYEDGLTVLFIFGVMPLAFSSRLAILLPVIARCALRRLWKLSRFGSDEHLSKFIPGSLFL